jgi:hypothetical protein
MFTRRTLTVWIGILVLSSMFLIGQGEDPPLWAPSDILYCEDVDGDGYGVRPALLCPFVLLLDCDDLNPDVHPRADEICNGIDDNCDTIVDYVDADGDGFFADDPPCTGDDCDDTNPDIHPGAVEACDGEDSDCDGNLPNAEIDVDSDQYLECEPYVGSLPTILGGGDCDNSAPEVNPGLTEASFGDLMCSDSLDNDCDGLTDFEDNGCQECQIPADCDDGNPCTDDDCVGNVCAYTNNSLPCDDGDPCTTNDTCSAGVCTGGPLLDGDSDGFVSDACPGGDDCLDSNPDVNPAGTEGPPGDPTCTDTLDNDCDGDTDDLEDLDCIADPCMVPSECDDGNPCTDDDCVNFHCTYADNALPCDDGDPCTMNDTCSAGVCTGGPPLDGDADGFVSDACPGGNDCLDSNPSVNPGETEGPLPDPTCSDTLDNDCDGLTDAADVLDCT